MHNLKRDGVDCLLTKARSGWAPPAVLLMSVSLAICFSACASEETNTNANNQPPESAKSAPLQKVPGDTPYSIDSVNKQPLPKVGPVVVKSADTPSVVIAGWAVDGPAKASAGGVMFNIDGKSDITATYGAERADVATVLKDPNYKMSGFGIAIPTQSIEKGRHTISMKILTSDKKGYYEPNRKIDIDIQ